MSTIEDRRSELAPVAPDTSSDSPGRARRREKLGLFVTGAVLGILALFIYSDLLRDVVPYIGKGATMAAIGIAAGWAGMGRARKLVWGFSAGAVLFALLVSYSPLVPLLMKGLVRSDPLERAPAVLVLAAGVDRRGVMNSSARTRLDRALEILGQGYADRLVLTQPKGPHNNWVPSIRGHIKALGLEYPIDALGPVVNTHDEAERAAALAKERGWSHILLVTHPWHMRRAAALFEKLGLRVVCVPCDELEYDPLNPKLGRARMLAFRDLAHEYAGLLEYRTRGWIQ